MLKPIKRKLLIIVCLGLASPSYGQFQEQETRGIGGSSENFFVTEDGDYLTFSEGLNNISGKIFIKEDQKSYPIEGKKIAGEKWEFSYFDSKSNRNIGKFEKSEIPINTLGTMKLAEFWVKYEDTSSKINISEFARIKTISENVANIQNSALYDSSINLSDITNVSKKTEKYFKSRGNSFENSASNSFASLSQNTKGISLITKEDRSFLPMLAANAKVLNSFENTFENQNIAAITVNKSSDLMVKVNPSIWSIYFEEAKSGKDISTELLSDVRIYPSKSRADKSFYTMNAAVFQNKIKLKVLMAKFFSKFDGKCEISNLEDDSAIICDYHSSMLGSDNSSWLRTRVDFVVREDIRAGAVVSPRKIFAFPNTVVARVFKINEYKKIRPAEFKQNYDYESFWELQDSFLDQVLNYVASEN